MPDFKPAKKAKKESFDKFVIKEKELFKLLKEEIASKIDEQIDKGLFKLSLNVDAAFVAKLSDQLVRLGYMVSTIERGDKATLNISWHVEVVDEKE
jgi:negative regulator of sigma E activity